MPRGPAAVSIVLTDEERETLVGWTRRRRSAAGLAQRSRIVLACERGATNMAVAAALGVSVPTVRRWRGRFAERRLDGLLDEPPDGGTHWSTRQMAAAVGLNQTAVSRIWRAFGLQPHRVEHWKLSKDPLFVEKVRDIVGLYLDPPERAIVLCVDEKSQIQALDRSAPTLPILPGTPARATHDYQRHGTSSLFAALNTTSGKVIRSLHARHRAVEFKKFLIKIEHEVPAELDVHLILDNYSTHKTPAIKNWLTRHPRFHLHFTPTGASWINLVERWFAELTARKLRRGTHRSVAELNADIQDWVEHWNENPNPYVWTKTADQILDTLTSYCNTINHSRH